MENNNGHLGLTKTANTFKNIKTIITTLVFIIGLVTGSIFWVQGSINKIEDKVNSRIEKLEDKVSDNDIRNNKQITNLLITLLKTNGTKSIDLD